MLTTINMQKHNMMSAYYEVHPILDMTITTPTTEKESWTQMRQELIASLRTELQQDIVSRVTPLENECNELKKKHSDLQQKCSKLDERCSFLENQHAADVAKISSMNDAFLLMERKIKFLEIMRQNEEYVHPLDVPDTDTLRDNGHTDEEVSEIREYAMYMRKVTYNVKRNRRDRLWSKHEICLHPREILRYYHELSPFWDEFIDALIEYKYTMDYFQGEDFSFRLINMELPRHLHTKLLAAFQMTQFYSMTFIDTLCDGEGDSLDFAINCITENPRLGRFCWGNTIANASNVNALYNAINRHGSLTSINFYRCENEDRALGGVFSSLKSKTLQDINLSDNKISNLIDTDLLQFFSSNTSLERLDLARNELVDNDIAKIALLLKNNTTLKTFVVDSVNPANDCIGLSRACFDITTFNTIWHSNHHCQIQYYQRTEAEWIIECLLDILNNFSDPQTNRSKKLYANMLMKHHFQQNVSQFHSEGIEVKHLPRILSLLKPFSERFHWREFMRQPELKFDSTFDT